MKLGRSGFIVIVMAVGIIFCLSTAALAATQGEVAQKLAAHLGLGELSAEAAVAALEGIGITPAGGWNAGAAADSNLVAGLYTATNAAVLAGTVTASDSFQNPSALVAAVCVEAGMPSNVVVQTIVAAGGNPASAQQGASVGATLAASPAAPVQPAAPPAPPFLGPVVPVVVEPNPSSSGSPT